MTTTPNHTTAPAELTPSPDIVQDLYSMDAINEWRSDELLRLGWLRTESIESGVYDDQYVTEFKSTIDDKLNDFLAAKGIAPDDAEYDGIRQMYRDSSIDRFSENEWGNSPASRGVDLNDRQSQSEKVAEAVNRWHAARTNETEADQSERSIDTIRLELDEARKSWADMQARRQGRLWDKRIPGYNAAKSRYEALQRELGSNTLESTINNDSLSDAEKNAAVIAYIFDEQNALRTLTKEKVKNTRVSKFVDKFGGWLNSGSGLVRFGKAAAVGVGAGVVGMGAGLLFGAAGMGALVAGAGAMTAKSALRFTKAYAKSDARQGRGMNEVEDGARDGWVDDLGNYDGDNIVDKAIGLSRQKFEADTKKEQTKRRKTTAIALGGLAAGATVGAAVGFILDGVGVSGDVKEEIFGGKPDATPVDPNPDTDPDTNPVNPNTDPGTDPDTDPVNPDPNVDPDTDPTDPNVTPDGEGAEPGGDYGTTEDEAELPGEGDTPVDGGIDWGDYVADHSDALIVESGEGWFQTFTELGISADDHAALLAEVGPELVDMDVAYYDSSIGGYGISRPGDMPVDALEYIYETAQSRGMSVSAIGLPSAGV